MTFFGTSASAAGLVLPKKYLTQVGDEGFKKRPSGPAPTSLSSRRRVSRSSSRPSWATGAVCLTSRRLS